MKRQPDFVSVLSWDEVEQRLASGCDGILPIGAGAKEHGLHLPLNTDQIQAEYLASAMAQAGCALIWPTLSFGHYPAFRDFPGSISLSDALFSELVREIVAEIVRWRVRRLFVLDTGISTIAPVARAVAAGAWEVPVIHVRIHDGPQYRATAAALQQQAFGSHADELETARMLAIAPEVVRMERAEASPGQPFRGPLSRARTPSGSYGDPSLATPAKGEALLAAMLEDLRNAMM
jgi:creatinine amidohydrolase